MPEPWRAGWRVAADPRSSGSCRGHCDARALQRSHCWTWLYCEKCLHHAPMGFCHSRRRSRPDRVPEVLARKNAVCYVTSTCSTRLGSSAGARELLTRLDTGQRCSTSFAVGLSKAAAAYGRQYRQAARSTRQPGSGRLDVVGGSGLDLPSGGTIRDLASFYCRGRNALIWGPSGSSRTPSRSGPHQEPRGEATMKWMSRFLLTLLAVVMLGDTMPVSAQVSSGSTNAAQQNARF
jgi:hypothetical protein